MNKNPNIIAIIPMMIAIYEKVLFLDFFISRPINVAEIPKKSKLNPPIMEITSDENIGNKINIKPIITDNIPALLFNSIFCHLP